MAKQLNILITQMGLERRPDSDRPVDRRGRLRHRVLLHGHGAAASGRTQPGRLDDADAHGRATSARRRGGPRRPVRPRKTSRPGATSTKRGVLWEATTAITLAMSGADVLVMRHPESRYALVRTAIEGLSVIGGQRVREKVHDHERERHEAADRRSASTRRPARCSRSQTRSRSRRVFSRSASMKPCPIGAEGACCKHLRHGPVPHLGQGQGAQARRLWRDDRDDHRTQLPADGRRRGSCPLRSRSRRGARRSRAIARRRDRGRRRSLMRSSCTASPACMGIDTEGKDVPTLAGEVADVALAQFGQQTGELVYASRAPEKRQELWRELGRHATRYRPRGRRGAPPHARRQRPELHQPARRSDPLLALERLGRLDARNRPAGHPLRHAAHRCVPRQISASCPRRTSTSSSTATSRCSHR